MINDCPKQPYNAMHGCMVPNRKPRMKRGFPTTTSYNK